MLRDSDNIDTSDLAEQCAAIEAAFLLWDLYQVFGE